MYLTLTINPSIDHYMRLPNGQLLTAGNSEAPSVNRAAEELFASGGKGINVAKVLKRLSPGSLVEATGFTAGFTGRELIRNIESEGIVSSFIEVPGHTRINLKVMDGNGIETEINGPGPKVTSGDIIRLISVIGQSSCDTLFISGSLSSGLSSDTYYQIASEALKAKPDLRLILDFEGEAMLKCLPLRPYLIKPNARELSALIGAAICTGSDTSAIGDAAGQLRDKGALNVLVSLGDKGACLITEDGDLLNEPGIKGEVVSTIGAGDTMLASFIHMLDRCHDKAKALRFSNECASYSAFTTGLPDASGLGAIAVRYG